MAEQISYDGFVALVERMVNQKESGSLYVRTDTNHSIFVGLRDGNIAALVAGPKRGMAAVQAVLKMSHCTCRRDDTPLALNSRDLPSTRDILTLLKNRAPLPAARGYSASSQEVDPQQAIKILCEILHDYVGPVAPIICEDVTQNGATIHTGADLQDAIEILAQEIDSGAEAAEFRTRAQENLKQYIA